MTDDDKKKGIDGHAKMMTVDKCGCDTALSTSYDNIKHYPHSGRWLVKGLFYCDKLWLCIHCDKCGYNWTLWKLGVPK